MMLMATLLVAMVVTAECQVNFPTYRPKPKPTSRPNKNKECTASNGQEGTCYEYRSTNFIECSDFFPSIDTSIPEVNKHLRANICNNTGREVHFCCPTTTPEEGLATKTSAQRPDFIPSEVECGISLSDNVVGGTIIAPGEYPWLAAIGTKTNTGFFPVCGGTLITKQHVITAAHCFRMPLKNSIVRLGEHDVTKANDGALDFNIVDKRQKEYNKETTENDIIILKLDRPLDSFTDRIRAACLPYDLRNDNFDGKNLTVVGWGIFDNDRGQISHVPQEGRVPVVPVQECQERYNNPDFIKKKYTIDDRQLCAGTGGTDSCKGDSGGPITYLDLKSGRFYVVGVVSFGPINCGDNNLPGVYARIGYYLDWIEETIKQLLL